MSRDPRTDPRPGDVLRQGEQTVRVVGRSAWWVYGADQRGALYLSLNRWQVWAQGAEVIERGE